MVDWSWLHSHVTKTRAKVIWQKATSLSSCRYLVWHHDISCHGCHLGFDGTTYSAIWHLICQAWRSYPITKHEVDWTTHYRCNVIWNFSDGGWWSCWMWCNQQQTDPLHPKNPTLQEVDWTTKSKEAGSLKVTWCRTRTILKTYSDKI